MEDGNYEGDYHNMAALIASAGDAGEVPVEDAGKAALIASAGDADEDPVEDAGKAALIASAGDADEDPVEDAGKSPDEKRFRLLLHRRFILI